MDSVRERPREPAGALCDPLMSYNESSKPPAFGPERES